MRGRPAAARALSSKLVFIIGAWASSACIITMLAISQRSFATAVAKPLPCAHLAH